MQATDLRVLLFEAVEDGFLVGFADGGGVFSPARRAVAELDPWQRYWFAEERVWWISQDAISRLARRIPALAEALGEWHQRTPSINDTVNSFYANIRPRAERRIFIPPEIAAAYQTLKLQPGASAEDVAMARRTLARQYHPDAGGGHATMVAINLAADTILRWLRQTA